jgi:hypothetical protein
VKGFPADTQLLLFEEVKPGMVDPINLDDMFKTGRKKRGRSFFNLQDGSIVYK